MRLCSLAAIAAWLAAAPLQAQTTLHASLSSAGVDANRNCDSPEISAEGLFVAFDSTATMLDPADTSSTRDVFLRDLAAGTTVLVSVATNGRGGDRASSLARLTANGAYVVFQSDATNLVSGDFNNQSDVFLRDIAGKVTRRMSVSSSGAAGNDASANGRASDDGAFVVFDSLATNLDAADGNGVGDIFRRDVAAGVTTRISLTDADAEANGRSLTPDISDDGTLVVFASFATNLVSGDSNGFADIYLRDLVAGTTRRLSLSATGAQPTNDCVDPVISGDGRFVAFGCYADNLVPHDTNGIHDVFVVEVATGAIERASLDNSGRESDGWSLRPSLSNDGRFVGFLSDGTNLGAGDWNNQRDFFVRDRQLGMTSWLSLGDQHQSGSNICEGGAICGDGSRAVFASKNPGFVATDIDSGLHDAFVRDRQPVDAGSSPYGSGLAGTLGVPSLALSAPPVLATTVDLQVGNSTRWYTVALLLAGTTAIDVPAWGGRLLVEPLVSIPVALFPGVTGVPIEIPPDDLLMGDRFYLQVVELDGGAPRGVSLTPGLDLQLGW